jgi:AcrR family transcriptional regulator
MSDSAITTLAIVGRWEPNASERLRGAAMELFVERGYEQTTVAEIAERAGLTSRTFFRYFADKREVLFDGAASLQAALVGALSAAPADASAMEAVSAALDGAGRELGERHDLARRRQAVIAANAELRERELIKLASLVDALADALRQRGVGDPDASLAAEAGVAVFRVGFERWVTGPADVDLGELMRDSQDRLKALTAG